MWCCPMLAVRFRECSRPSYHVAVNPVQRLTPKRSFASANGRASLGYHPRGRSQIALSAEKDDSLRLSALATRRPSPFSPASCREELSCALPYVSARTAPSPRLP